MGQLRWSAGLLEATCPARLRPELFSAVGYLADTAGFMAFDAGAHDDAHRVFCFALTCAEQADDWHLRARVLSSMALQAIRTGRPDEGLTLAEQALVRADRLTATGQAMLHANRGLALAKMRRVSETLTAIGTAEDHFAHSTPDNDPPYIASTNPSFSPRIPGRPCSTSRYSATTSRRPPTDSPPQPPGTPPATPVLGRSARPSWPVSRWPPATRSRPPPSDTRPWTPPAPSAPAKSPMTCANWPDTPPLTSTSTRSPTCGTGSPPWCVPLARREDTDVKAGANNQFV
jgi:hypothetical protein